MTAKADTALIIFRIAGVLLGFIVIYFSIKAQLYENHLYNNQVLVKGNIVKIDGLTYVANFKTIQGIEYKASVNDWADFSRAPVLGDTSDIIYDKANPGHARILRIYSNSYILHWDSLLWRYWYLTYIIPALVIIYMVFIPKKFK